MAMDKLRALDHIAYIRFASVYQSFEDLEDLKREVDSLFAEGDARREGEARRMSVLADRDIRAELESGRVRIDPYDPSDLQPSSVDLHLDRELPRLPQQPVRVHRPAPAAAGPDRAAVDHRTTSRSSCTRASSCSARPLEWVELPDDLVARLEGKSSLGRLGLLIHSTAGYVDPGWKGTLTLELSNVANLPIALYAGMRIGQISFFRMSSPVERPYGSKELGSKYQGQSEPTASAFHADFERGRRKPRADA